MFRDCNSRFKKICVFNNSQISVDAKWTRTTRCVIYARSLIAYAVYTIGLTQSCLVADCYYYIMTNVVRRLLTILPTSHCKCYHNRLTTVACLSQSVTVDVLWLNFLSNFQNKLPYQNIDSLIFTVSMKPCSLYRKAARSMGCFSNI